jgi:CubicO group peptidase (beta-lactamase class C family)
VLGVLLARVEETTLGAVLDDTVLDPLGMDDTGFAVPAGQLDRMTSLHGRDPVTGAVHVLDPPDGQWASDPEFPSGSGGLVSTADDWLGFGRMLLADGDHHGRQVLSPAAVALMTTRHVEAEPDNPFLDGHGWGFGGSVDLAPSEPWNVPGRYGWIGGTGTAGYVIPSNDRVLVWLAQVEFGGPEDAETMVPFLTWASGRS